MKKQRITYDGYVPKMLSIFALFISVIFLFGIPYFCSEISLWISKPLLGIGIVIGVLLFQKLMDTQSSFNVFKFAITNKSFADVKAELRSEYRQKARKSKAFIFLFLTTLIIIVCFCIYRMDYNVYQFPVILRITAKLTTSFPFLQLGFMKNSSFVFPLVLLSFNNNGCDIVFLHANNIKILINAAIILFGACLLVWHMFISIRGITEYKLKRSYLEFLKSFIPLYIIFFGLKVIVSYLLSDSLPLQRDANLYSLIASYGGSNYSRYSLFTALEELSLTFASVSVGSMFCALAKSKLKENNDASNRNIKYFIKELSLWKVFILFAVPTILKITTNNLFKDFQYLFFFIGMIIFVIDEISFFKKKQALHLMSTFLIFGMIELALPTPEFSVQTFPVVFSLSIVKLFLYSAISYIIAFSENTREKAKMLFESRAKNGLPETDCTISKALYLSIFQIPFITKPEIFNERKVETMKVSTGADIIDIGFFALKEGEEVPAFEKRIIRSKFNKGIIDYIYLQLVMSIGKEDYKLFCCYSCRLPNGTERKGIINRLISADGYIVHTPLLNEHIKNWRRGRYLVSINYNGVNKSAEFNLH